MNEKNPEIQAAVNDRASKIDKLDQAFVNKIFELVGEGKH